MIEEATKQGIESRTFAYDNKVVMQSSNGRNHIYMLDEMGSPVRVSDYEREYLTYGYDEYGRTLDWSKEAEEGIPNPYAEQGEEQPFGYTGYRYDWTAGSYYAQAREYLPEAGRFMAVDKVKGNIATPISQNNYIYCQNKSLDYVDLDGRDMMSSSSAAENQSEFSWEKLKKDIDEFCENHKMTIGVGISGGGSLPGLSGQVGLKLYLDTSGNAGLFFSGEAGVAYGADVNVNFPDISILPGCDTIYDVEGFYSNFGVNICPDVVGPHLAVELANSGEGNNTKLDGINLAMGTGVGADVHFSMGKSYELISGNYIEAIKGLFVNDKSVSIYPQPHYGNVIRGINYNVIERKRCCE